MSSIIKSAVIVDPAKSLDNMWPKFAISNTPAGLESFTGATGFFHSSDPFSLTNGLGRSNLIFCAYGNGNSPDYVLVNSAPWQPDSPVHACTKSP